MSKIRPPGNQVTDKKKVSGKVKWWSDSKGFGFIQQDKRADFFVHHSEIKMKGIITLEEGEPVVFEISDSGKGRSAVNVMRQRDLEPSSSDEDSETYVALGLFGDKIRAIGLCPDGSYHFLDDQNFFHKVIYILSHERIALGEAIEELEELINNSRAQESDFQNFFERHPEFILNEDYQHAHSHVVLSREDGGALIPDFVLEPVDSPLSDILELKLPTAKMITEKKNRCRFASAVYDACAQLREYARFFEEERYRRLIYEKFGLLLYRPRMFVILGRRGDIDPIQMRAIQADIPQLDVKTYDDVILRMKRKLHSIKK